MLSHSHVLAGAKEHLECGFFRRFRQPDADDAIVMMLIVHSVVRIKVSTCLRNTKQKQVAAAGSNSSLGQKCDRDKSVIKILNDGKLKFFDFCENEIFSRRF